MRDAAEHRGDPPVRPADRVLREKLTSLARAIDDLHAMLVAHGGWVPLGSADENKPVKDGTVEAWGRATDNPASGFYGQ